MFHVLLLSEMIVRVRQLLRSKQKRMPAHFEQSDARLVHDPAIGCKRFNVLANPMVVRCA